MNAAGMNASRGSGADGDAGAVRRRQLVLFSVLATAVLIVLAVSPARSIPTCKRRRKTRPR